MVDERAVDLQASCWLLEALAIYLDWSIIARGRGMIQMQLATGNVAERRYQTFRIHGHRSGLAWSPIPIISRRLPNPDEVRRALLRMADPCPCAGRDCCAD